MSRAVVRLSLLSIAIFGALQAHAKSVEAAIPQTPGAGDRVTVETVTVRGESKQLDDGQLPPEIEGNRILEAKKVTRVELDQQPAIVDNNIRQTLARVPGLFISDQTIPTHHNVNYRGLGDPHESEYVLFAANGTPILSDWFGYPTVYYSPIAQRIGQIDFIRGGSSLLYGPQPGPSINLILRKPLLNTDTQFRSDNVFGSNGFFGTFNEFATGNEKHGLLATFDSRHADGERAHSGYEVDGASLSWAYQPDDVQSWELSFDSYDSHSNEPGRLSLAQYQTDRNQTTTPYNQVWIKRWRVGLKHERLISDQASIVAQAWSGYQDRLSQRTSGFAAGDPLPGYTTIDRQQFEFSGLDLRYLREWGSNHSFTAGTTLYHSDSPRSQHRSTDLINASNPTARYLQQRGSQYAAVFFENAFRFGAWRVVPALRFESLDMDVRESLKLSSLSRPAYDVDESRTEALLGLGVSRDFGDNWQAYGNYSQGYRPMRYDDIGNPTAELAASNEPDSASADNFELGLRGMPVQGLFLDISAFHIDLQDKIEQRLINPTDIIRVNSGDSRHRGIELALEYDVLKALNQHSGASLVLFANGAWLDAEITRSETASLVGNAPGFAPDLVSRAGALWEQGKVKLALTGTYVSDQFWQDSNQSRGTGASFIPAEIPSYSVWDLSAEYAVNDNVALTAGVNNLFDEQYFSRVRSDGIDPAAERSVNIGFRIKL